MKITLYARGVDADLWAWARDRAWQNRSNLSRFIADTLHAMRDQETRNQQAADQPPPS